MQNRKYYFAGHPLLTEEYSGFMQTYDIALYNTHPITPDRIVASIDNDLVIYKDKKHLAKFSVPVYGESYDPCARPQYQVPIFTAYIPDEDYLHWQNPNSYTINHKYVILYDVSVCGESHISAFYPSSYHSMVKAGQPDNLPAEIKALFYDYSHPRFGLFLTLHWNRHYTQMANEIMRDIPVTVREAYNYLSAQRKKMVKQDTTNLNGSFMRRMDFALGKLLAEMDQSNENRVRPGL